MFAGLLSSGCATSRSLRIEAVEKKGTVVAPRFRQAFYRFDRDKTLYFVMRTTSTDRSSGDQVEQIVIARIFWQPRGGKTTMNPAALNATFRYIVMTPKAVGMYEGAGFVRLSDKPGSREMRVRVVDGDLRLAETSAAFNDNLGRSRFRGNFTAKLSPVQTFDLMEAAHRDFFSRSLTLGGAKPTPEQTPADIETATQPATME